MAALHLEMGPRSVLGSFLVGLEFPHGASLAASSASSFPLTPWCPGTQKASHARFGRDLCRHRIALVKVSMRACNGAVLCECVAKRAA